MVEGCVETSKKVAPVLQLDSLTLVTAVRKRNVQVCNALTLFYVSLFRITRNLEKM